MESTKLSIPRLLGQSNYDIWSLRMESILIEKGLDDAIIDANTTIPPITEEAKQLLLVKANKALALIRLAISDGPLLQIRNIKTPLEAWNTLKNLYSPKGFSSEFLLLKELFNTTLSNSESMEGYLNIIKRITDDLTGKGLEIPTKLILAWILNNLTPEYENFTSIITQNLRVNNTIDLEQLYANLLDESRRLGSKEDNYSLITKGKIAKSTLNKTSKRCTYCKRTGHLEDTCFKKDPSKRKDYKSNTPYPTIKDEVTLATTALPTTKLSAITGNWVLDSGATSHICYNKAYFKDLRQSNTSIQWGQTTTIIKAAGIGTISINTPIGVINITDVLYIPDFQVNLISLGCLVNKGVKISFNKENCSLNIKDKILSIKKTRGLFILPFTPTTSSMVFNTTTFNKELWHLRLGHLGDSTIRYLPNAVQQLPKEDTPISITLPDTSLCISCKEANLKATISREPSTKQEDFLGLVTTDICGPLATISKGGYRYFITFLDSKTRWLDLYPIRSKADTLSIFKTYKTMIEL